MGKIERVLPGLNCAFVSLEFGLAGFLPLEEGRYPQLFALIRLGVATVDTWVPRCK